MRTRTAFLFPGQGAYLPGLLGGFPGTYPQVDTVLRQIDGVCAEYGHDPVSGLLLDAGAPRIDTLLTENPELLHLCIFTASLACAAVCEAEGIRPDVLVGHSFGEWAALTLAGVWTPVEAARLICERDRVCRQTAPEPGGLLAVGLGPHEARHLAAVVDDWSLNVAVCNGPGQCVLAGPDAGLARAEAAAAALGVQAVRIKAAYAYHSPWLRAAGEAFGEVMGRAPARLPARRVYSPIAAGYVVTIEDVRRIGAEHMVRPVDFLAALHALQRDGVTAFVECGAKDIVTRLAAGVLPGVRTAAPLVRRGGPDAARAVLTTLTSDSAPHTTAASVAAQVPTPRSASSSAQEADPAPAAEPAPALDPAPVPDPVPAAPAAVPPPSGAEPLPDRPALVASLRAYYAKHLGYPPDVITADADLEADLGVDSLRQTEMLTSLYTHYGLDASDSADPVRRQNLEDIADHLLALPRAMPSAAGVAAS